jgi:hypothetical protein
MTPSKKTSTPEAETQDLLKKLLVLQLFQLDVPQTVIAKKLKVNTIFVNEFLKGIKKK